MPYCSSVSWMLQSEKLASWSPLSSSISWGRSVNNCCNWNRTNNIHDMLFRKINTSSAQKHWQSRPHAHKPGFLPPRKNSQRDLYHRMLTRLGYQPKHFSAKLLIRKELHQEEVKEMHLVDMSQDSLISKNHLQIDHFSSLNSRLERQWTFKTCSFWEVWMEIEVRTCQSVSLHSRSHHCND